MLTIQTLISTMYQEDHSLLDRMNIQTDAIVVNQCDFNKIERFEWKGHNILWMSLKEKGVGLSRNTLLMRATADIVLFADDDVCYKDGYNISILETFQKHPNADFIVFSLISNRINKKDVNHKNDIFRKLHWYNVLHYGTVRFAVRHKKIVSRNISFHLLFGGGAKYSCGEDSIFIIDALKRNLKVFFSTVCIGKVFNDNSTWFKGYNDKYFFDKGVLLRYIFGIWGYFFGLLIILKNYKNTKEIGLFNAVKNFFYGVRKIL